MSDIVLLIAFFVQLVVAAMWIRSAFFLYRIRKHTNLYEMIVLALPVLIGSVLSTYNLSDPDYLLMRFPIRAFLNITCAWAIYAFSKDKKEELFDKG